MGIFGYEVGIFGRMPLTPVTAGVHPGFGYLGILGIRERKLHLRQHNYIIDYTLLNGRCKHRAAIVADPAGQWSGEEAFRELVRPHCESGGNRVTACVHIEGGYSLPQLYAIAEGRERVPENAKRIY